MSYERRRARNGKGLLPPNPGQWENEHNGLDLREDLAVSLDEVLDESAPFRLLRDVVVVGHSELPMGDEDIAHLCQAGCFSGAGIPLPEGGAMVIFNDSHPRTRIRSTLMEEFFHLRLGHETSKLRIYGSQDAQRSHSRLVENEAFGSGAAALVPYKALRKLVDGGTTIAGIASAFQVSSELVTFRLKVTKLYGKYWAPRRAR